MRIGLRSSPLWQDSKHDSYQFASAEPTVSQYSFEENLQQFGESSCTFDLKIPNVPNMQVGFMNGVFTDKSITTGHANYLSKLGNDCNIQVAYNGTHGLFDLGECYLGMNHIATEPVKMLHENWNNFFDKSSPDANYLQVGHSQALIHIKNGLMSYPDERRQRILVLAIAPAVYIPKKICKDVFHYRAKFHRDPIPHVFDLGGAMRCRDTIIELDSHPNAPSWDHAVQSKTYKKYIRDHFDNYMNNGGKGL